eukprot:358388-Pleurochrysis_carterae.AAC.1
MDTERLEEQLDADNERYAQGRHERARIKNIFKCGRANELIELRRELSDDLVVAQHHAARDPLPDSYGDVIRRLARWLTRLDERE